MMSRTPIPCLLALGLLVLGGPGLAGPGDAKKKKTAKATKSSASSPRGARAIANTLKTRRVSFKFEKATLDQFVKYMRAATGINIFVNKARIERDGGDVDSIEIDLELQNVTALDAFKVALQGRELGFKVRGNVLVITSKKDVLGKPVLRIYSVAHLLVPLRDFPAPDIHLRPSGYIPPEPPEPEVQQTFESSDQLAELVRQFTGRETWEDEGVQITVFRNHLFVRTYPRVHREVAQFLARLPR